MDNNAKVNVLVEPSIETTDADTDCDSDKPDDKIYISALEINEIFCIEEWNEKVCTQSKIYAQQKFLLNFIVDFTLV